MEKCQRCGKEINLIEGYVEIDEFFPEGSKFKLHEECYKALSK